MWRRMHGSSLFPYTTLFRSGVTVAYWAEARGNPLLTAVGADQTATMTSDRKSTRLNSSHLGISYAVFCLKKKKHDNAAITEPRRLDDRDVQRAGQLIDDQPR